jgi:hypothetical protein
MNLGISEGIGVDKDWFVICLGQFVVMGKHLAVMLNTTKCSQIQWFLLKIVQ